MSFLEAVKCCFLVCSIGIGLAVQSQGSVIVIGDRADRTINSEGTKIDASVSHVGAGTDAPGPGARSLVFVFQLPVVPDGQPAVVSSADLQFTIVTDRADGLYNIDLYALPARSTSTVQSTDRFAGALDASATLIEDNIIPSVNTYTGVIHTSSDADLLLIQYLNGVYGPSGDGAGQWVFLRLNPDQNPPAEISGVDVAQANNATGKLDSQKPTLTIDFVPEPSFGGFVLGGVIVACRRRLRRKTPKAARSQIPKAR